MVSEAAKNLDSSSLTGFDGEALLMMLFSRERWNCLKKCSCSDMND